MIANHEQLAPFAALAERMEKRRHSDPSTDGTIVQADSSGWEKYIPQHPLKRLAVAAAGLGAVLTLTHAATGRPDMSTIAAAAYAATGKGPDTPTLVYERVMERTPKREEDGEGPFVRLTVFAPPDLDISQGTITILSETTQRYPGTSNTELKTVTDVIDVSEPYEPSHITQFIGYTPDLDKTDFGGQVELRPGKKVSITIFQRGEGLLEKGNILAHTDSAIPTEMPVVPTR